MAAGSCPGCREARGQSQELLSFPSPSLLPLPWFLLLSSSLSPGLPLMPMGVSGELWFLVSSCYPRTRRSITYLGLANKSLILAMLCLRYILQRPRGDAKWAVDTWNWSSGEGQDNEIWEILLHRWYQSHVTVRHHAETVYKYTKKKTKECSVRSKENYEMPCHTCQQKKEEGVS